jgi:hypothetical protein
MIFWSTEGAEGAAASCGAFENGRSLLSITVAIDSA